MKRLNRKGFTLIELLAVIVILAIVLVVTIPSVINTMNDARDRSLQNAADTVEEWYTKQYEMSVLGSELGSTTSSVYNSFPVSTDKKMFNESNGNRALIAAGVSNPNTNLNLEKSSVQLLSTKKICVKLAAAEDGGNFHVNATGYTNCKCSSGCASTSSTCSCE